MSEVGAALRTIRENAGMSADAVAVAMGKPSTYSRSITLWETGKREPKITNVLAFLKAAGSDLHALQNELFPPSKAHLDAVNAVSRALKSLG